MLTSRLTAALLVTAISVGGGAALAGCGASDISDQVNSAKTSATKLLDQATSDAQKQLDQAEKEAKSNSSLSASQKADIDKRIADARKKLDDAKKKLNDALGN